MRPAPALVALLVLCALPGLAIALGIAGWAWLPAIGIALALVAAVDALRLRAVPTPSLVRELAPIVAVGLEHPVVLRLRPAGARALKVLVHDNHPGPWQVAGLPRAIRLEPAREVELTYRITPPERGRFVFDGCALALRSPWRLWRQRRIATATSEVRVYPDFAPFTRLALVGVDRASHVVGAHLTRRRGEGTEFQQLREYRVGDSLRQVDWKASRRMRKLISREYQDERNQQVLLILDTGRRMLARDGVLSHFDHVLNASIMVAYIALRQGDAVGLLACGGDTRHVAPRRGPGTIDTLLNATYDLSARPVATDYLECAALVCARQKRRCLAILVTNARDEDSDDLLAAVTQLRRRHLVCVASLREGILGRAAGSGVATFGDALRIAATARYLEQRERAHGVLRANGAQVLDVTCEQLPRALVEHYLASKRAARL